MRLKAITDPRNPASFARRALLGLASLLAVALVVGGSIAIAKQGDMAEPNRSRTVISSSDNGQYVDIRSDYIRVTNAELVEGKLKVPEGQVSTYHGNVQVRGRLRAPETTVLLDGKAPPAGFDPTRLPKGAIERIEAVSKVTGGKSRVTLNVVLAAGFTPL